MGQHIEANIWERDDGQRFSTGCLPPKHTEKFKLYGAKAVAQPIYTRAEIEAKIKAGAGSLKDWIVAITNQTSHPWCWAFSASGTLMSVLWMLGFEKVILDPAIGPLVTGETGGNSIDAMITEVQTVYGQPDAKFTGNDPVGGDVSTRTIPKDWKPDAAKRIVPGVEWVRCENYEAVASALINSHMCCWGLNWDGGGHALQVAEVTMGNKGQLVFAGPNSWGMDYDSGFGSYPGRPGWWQFSESRINGVFDDEQFGAYCLAGARDTAV